MAGLAGGKLNRIRSSFHNGFHSLRHVLNSCEKARLVKKAVIDGDIKAAAGFGVEETVEAICFHKLGMSETDYMQSKRSNGQFLLLSNTLDSS
jgi:hypothetical protein